MLAGADADEASRRRPFEFLSSIFKKRRDLHDDELDHSTTSPEINFEEADFLRQHWHRRNIQEDNSGFIPISSSFLPAVNFMPSATTAPSPLHSSSVMATNTAPLATISYTNIVSPPSPVALLSSPYMDGKSSTSPAQGGGAPTCASPIIVHHTPIRSRDIGEDMEAIRLSRQDNPYLQRVAGSQPTLVDEECDESGVLVEEEDTTQLVSQTQESQQDALSLEEIHEHLIRSPPPTSVPKTLTGKAYFVFSSEFDGYSDGSKTLPTNIKGHSLNPLLSKRHEDVLDQHLKQILDTQRRLSIPKAEVTTLSSSVPGSPARATSHSLPFHHRKNNHLRTNSEEASLVSSLGPSGCYSGEGWSVGRSAPLKEGSLAPVQLTGKKLRAPSKIKLSRPIATSSSPSSPPITASSLRPLNKSNQFKRSSSLKGPTLAPQSNGSSSSLTLPIRYPYQPAPYNET